MVQRISDTVLPNDYLQDGDILEAKQLNVLVTLLKGGVNQNYEDIKKLLGVGSSGSVTGLFEYLGFNTLPTLPDPQSPGQLYYDKDFHTFSFTGTLGNKHEIGQNLEGLGKKDNEVSHDYVDAEIVTWSRAQGDHKLFIPADASDPAKSLMIGVLTTVPNEESDDFAIVSVFGEVRVSDFRDIMDGGSDAGITFGSKLYLSSTTPGKYTTIQPARPNASIWVATVVSFNASSHKGRIFVYPVRERVENGTLIYSQNTQPTALSAGDMWFDTSS